MTAIAGHPARPPRVSLKIVANDTERVVKLCSECPLYRDGDPWPDNCALDLERYDSSPSENRVCVAGEVPHNCPLRSLRVTVKEIPQ